MIALKLIALLSLVGAAAAHYSFAVFASGNAVQTTLSAQWIDPSSGSVYGTSVLGTLGTLCSNYIQSSQLASVQSELKCFNQTFCAIVLTSTQGSYSCYVGFSIDSTIFNTTVVSSGSYNPGVTFLLDTAVLNFVSSSYLRQVDLSSNAPTTLFAFTYNSSYYFYNNLGTYFAAKNLLLYAEYSYDGSTSGIYAVSLLTGNQVPLPSTVNGTIQVFWTLFDTSIFGITKLPGGQLATFELDGLRGAPSYCPQTTWQSSQFVGASLGSDQLLVLFADPLGSTSVVYFPLPTYNTCQSSGTPGSLTVPDGTLAAVHLTV